MNKTKSPTVITPPVYLTADQAETWSRIRRLCETASVSRLAGNLAELSRLGQDKRTESVRVAEAALLDELGARVPGLNRYLNDVWIADLDDDRTQSQAATDFLSGKV